MEAENEIIGFGKQVLQVAWCEKYLKGSAERKRMGRGLRVRVEARKWNMIIAKLKTWFLICLHRTQIQY